MIGIRRVPEGFSGIYLAVMVFEKLKGIHGRGAI